MILNGSSNTKILSRKEGNNTVFELVVEEKNNTFVLSSVQFEGGRFYDITIIELFLKKCAFESLYECVRKVKPVPNDTAN